MNNVSCFYCGSEDVITIGFLDFGYNDIEIEQIKCKNCHKETNIPLQNKRKQLRENILELGTK